MYSVNKRWKSSKVARKEPNLLELEWLKNGAETFPLPNKPPKTASEGVVAGPSKVGRPCNKVLCRNFYQVRLEPSMVNSIN